MDFNHIRGLLGKPYFEAKNCLIYCGDCSEAMKKLDGQSIDLTVTSPPYNIGKEYERPLRLPEYLQWCENWISQIHEITKSNGAFWLNIGYLEIPDRAKAIPIPYLLWDKIEFYLVQEIVWNYGAGVAGKKFFSPRNEKVLWYVKDKENYTFNLDNVRDKNVKYPNQKKNGKLKCNPLGKNPTDVWQIPKVTSGTNRSSRERTPHPAQFPVALIDRIIKASTNKNDLVMDPFLGSGTSALVALANDRKFIGFEIEPKYCKIAVERVRQFIAAPQPTPLFQLTPTTPVTQLAYSFQPRG